MCGYNYRRTLKLITDNEFINYYCSIFDVSAPARALRGVSLGNIRFIFVNITVRLKNDFKET